MFAYHEAVHRRLVSDRCSRNRAKIVRYRTLSHKHTYTHTHARTTLLALTVTENRATGRFYKRADGSATPPRAKRPAHYTSNTRKYKISHLRFDQIVFSYFDAFFFFHVSGYDIIHRKSLCTCLFSTQRPPYTRSDRADAPERSRSVFCVRALF